MGTTNRAFTPSLHKAMMLNNANSTGRKHRTDRTQKRFEAEKKTTFMAKIKNLCESVFRFFGFGRKAYIFPVATFSTPAHSAPYRSADQLAKKKAHRRKRRKLIMKRGYA